MGRGRETTAIAFAIAAAVVIGVIGCADGASVRDDGVDEVGSTSAGVDSGVDDGTGADDGLTAADSEGPQPDMGVPVIPTCEPTPPSSALALIGAEDGVHVGHVPALGLATFTVEAWVRWDGYGTAASSGVDGVVAEPIASKGRGEDDGDTRDCNYFVGIDAAGHLVADFEDMAAGDNHPAASAAAIDRGRWTHVAATFDGASWRLYLDGMLDATVAADAMPRADSIQHFGIGAAYDSMGVPLGSFDGRIDEVRVWSRPLAELELQLGMYADEPSGDGLVARWPLDETDGTSVPETVAGYVGERGTATWVSEGRPRVVSTPPAPPLTATPLETAPAGDVEIAMQVFDADDDEMVVRVYGRELVDVEPFSVIVLPDTQYFCDGTHGGEHQMFYDQTQWIRDNAEALDIRAVLHVGDFVDNGDVPEQWNVGETAIETLEQALPEFPDGMPYGIAVGNHDQDGVALPGHTEVYNQRFGVARFEGRSYYGGHYGEKNDASYITFDAGGLQFLAFFFEFDNAGQPEANTGRDVPALAWARRIIAEHPDHYAFVVSHSCLSGTADGAHPTVGTPYSAQGLARYQALRGEPNLRLQFCGHVKDEGRRTDIAASTVHALLSDYQFDGAGGSGKLRIVTFRPRDNEIEVQTYSPFLDQWYETPDAHFVLPLDLDRGGAPFELVGEVEHVVSGTAPSVVWPALPAGREFEWYATVSDCTHEITTPHRLFTTQ